MSAKASVRIVLSGVGVDFPVLNPDMRSLRSQLVYLGSGGRLKRDVGRRLTVSALEDIDFRAAAGDRIGLVGRNGAGKSTLLRVLAGILEPTAGARQVDGSISTLLTLSLALDEELSGYQMIEYGGRLMGLRPREIARLAPGIAEFTELGDYLSMPLRTYSAGMRMRLQFGIATCYKPDVVLLDEAIGAGDAHFVEKAKKRIVEFMEGSSIVVLASHSSDLIQTLCNKAVLMDRGRIVLAGPVDDVLEYYMESAEPRTPWLSKERGDEVAGRASIGVDCAEPTEMRRLVLRQWCGAALPNTVCAARVQSSDDGFRSEPHDVARLELVPGVGLHAYDIPASAPRRHWRLLADAPTGGGPWGIMELDFRSAEPAV